MSAKNDLEEWTGVGRGGVTGFSPAVKRERVWNSCLGKRS